MARRSLLTLRSNLRELKYSSPKRQPYIYTPLPAYNESGPNVYIGPDLMGRNGRSFAAQQDFTRISRFFSDKSNAAGLFFVTKQNALEKTAPKTPYGPSRAYNPANTLAQIAASGTGIHFDKRGLTPDISNRQKYGRATLDRFNTNDTNRLTLLYKHKIGGQPGGGGAFRIAKNNDNTLIRYGGGPNSLGGIGFTTLRRYTNTVNWYKASASNEMGPLSNSQKVIALTPDLLFKKEKSKSTGFSSTGGDGISNFILELNSEAFKEEDKKRILGRLTSYAQFNRRTTFGIADPGQSPVDRQAYYKDKPIVTTGVDVVNRTPIYSSQRSTTDKPEEASATRDMIKFYMAVVDNDDPLEKKFIHFRAYIKNIEDSYEADWDSFKYLGRGENFYKYQGFDRRISFDFDVHIGSRFELFNVYNKLNYFASINAPDYSSTGFMRGNIIQLTIGDYINNVYGITTGFSIGIPEDATWEIARKDDGSVDEWTGELPTLLNIRGFTFKPIHNFVPKLVKTPSSPEAKFMSLGADNKGYKKAL